MDFIHKPHIIILLFVLCCRLFMFLSCNLFYSMRVAAFMSNSKLFIGWLICLSIHWQAGCLVDNVFFKVMWRRLTDWMTDGLFDKDNELSSAQRAVWAAWKRHDIYLSTVYWMKPALLTVQLPQKTTMSPVIFDQIWKWTQPNIAAMFIWKCDFVCFPLQALYNSIKNQKLQWTL